MILRISTVMVNQQDARKLVLTQINEEYNIPGDELVIRDEKTIEKSYGWIFFYNSKRYLQTQEIHYLVIGNGPIIFERDSGNIVRLTSACSANESIEDYEKRRQIL
jgi:hypothetical protein